jgi:uncharacterized iron-regulated membrane protein
MNSSPVRKAAIHGIVDSRLRYVQARARQDRALLQVVAELEQTHIDAGEAL